MKIDRAATAAQHYKDPKSYRTLDGREVLYRKDWEQRKLELWERCGGRCEYRLTWKQGRDTVGVRCQREANDPHHLRARSKGRDDRLNNLQALCRHHHRLLEK